MKPLFWVGLILLVLGIASFFVPLPGRQRDSVQIGGMSLGIETRHDEKTPPAVGAIVIVAGAALLIAGRRRSSA